MSAAKLATMSAWPRGPGARSEREFGLKRQFEFAFNEGPVLNPVEGSDSNASESLNDRGYQQLAAKSAKTSARSDPSHTPDLGRKPCQARAPCQVRVN